jgi:hypothetical protein
MFQKLKMLSGIKKVGLGIAVVTILGVIGGTHHPQTVNLNQQKPDPSGVLGSQTTSTSASKPKPKAPVITAQTATETQAIPFASTTVNTASLPKGTSKITTPGVDGVSTLTYKITYSDSVEIKRELVSQITTTPPVTQVTSVGTYVAPPPPSCPNGTYVNSAGNTICSPYVSNSAPAGATAQCRDGSYSFSQSHSGTCSHHGGVAQWL